MIEWTIFFVVWVVCGILAYGINFAHFQRGFPFVAKEHYRLDIVMSLVVGLVGPVTLIIQAFSWKSIRLYGLMYRRPKEKKKVDYSFPEGEPDW